MKIRIILLVFTVSSFAVTAQVKNFEIKAAANATFINSAVKDLNPIALIPVNPATAYTYTTINLGSIKESYESGMGFDVSSSFQVWEHKKFFLRTGLGIQYLRFQRSITIDRQSDQDPILGFPTDIGSIRTGYPFGTLVGVGIPRNPDGSIFLDPNGFPTGQSQLFGENRNIGKTTAVYLQIPVSIGRSFFSEKLMVSANVQAQFLAQATVVKEEYSYSNGINEYKDKSGDGFKNTLFLIGVEGAYKIFNPLAVSLAYNRSLTPIYDEGSQVAGKTFYNNVSFGVSYSLSK